MKYVFDNVIFSKENQGGISNYWYELVKDFADSENAYFYEEKGLEKNIFRKKLKFKNIASHYQLPLPLARLLPVNIKSIAGNAVYHSSFYRKLVTSAKVCEITTVHDFTHNLYSSAIKKVLHNQLKFDTIKRSQGIICISNNTLKDLKTYCAPTKNQSVAVIYNGVSDDYYPIKNENSNSIFNELGISGNYLLYVGARSSYKNFNFAVSLLSVLPDFKLVVVGKELSVSDKSVIDKELLTRIVVATSIENERLNILYNHAYALLYPSSYEGFGIPVVEAMKAGCPVIAMNSSSIPEVAGNAAILLNTLSIDECKKALEFLKVPENRTSLITAGLENAKKYSWKKCVKETKEFYEEVCNSYFNN